MQYPMTEIENDFIYMMAFVHIRSNIVDNDIDVAYRLEMITPKVTKEVKIQRGRTLMREMFFAP